MDTYTSSRLAEYRSSAFVSRLGSALVEKAMRRHSLVLGDGMDALGQRKRHGKATETTSSYQDSELLLQDEAEARPTYQPLY